MYGGFHCVFGISVADFCFSQNGPGYAVIVNNPKSRWLKGFFLWHELYVRCAVAKSSLPMLREESLSETLLGAVNVDFM